MKKITNKEWKNRYYPKPASKVSKAGALEHSIHKWTGLALYGNQTEMIVDADTCALCKHYQRELLKCTGCPLFKSRGNVRCDTAKYGEEDVSPYGAWTKNGDAIPMLTALLKARDI